MLWLKRLNFMETAKLEMELMKAFEAGVDLDAKLADQAALAPLDGLARPRAARPTGSRLRLRRARPGAIQRS